MNKFILFSLLWLSFASLALAHDKTKIIIDTDGGADDLRAISLIFASGKFDVAAITVSDGVLSPSSGLNKIRSLLCTLHHQGIPVAAGRTTVTEPCECRRQNEKIIWGTICDDFPDQNLSAPDLINQILSHSGEKIIFFQFGSLTNLNDALQRNPLNREKIEKIFWYNESLFQATGFNFESDSVSAKKITELNLPLVAVSNNPVSPVAFDEHMLNIFRNSNTPCGNLVYSALSANEVMTVIASGHFKLWDELLPVCFLNPNLFDTVKTNGNMAELELKTEAIKVILENVLSAMLSPDIENIVFKRFPTDKSMFEDDFEPIVDTLLLLYGEEEFRAGVLTNELHGHLGVYAIIGVKMGMRAIEYFACDIDELRIVSCAGNEPPVSCLNDGLQVSTGATVGHGLISIIPESNEVTAEFFHDSDGIRITLKSEYLNQIQSEFKRIIQNYGLFTDEYWQQIRQLAIRCWLQYDRNIIFDISPAKTR